MKVVKAPMDEYAAQDDLHTIMRAHKVKSDPKRMAAVRAHHAAQKAALAQMKQVGSPMEAETQGEMPLPVKK